MTRLRALIACILATAVAPAAAQNYRARVDASSQVVSFRGLVADSIAVALVVPSAGGGLETPDGHAVRCGAGEYCFFFRPGPVLRGAPVTTSASLILWGLGVQGLTVRATGRLLADVWSDQVWPGTDPSAQLIEGYLDYQRGPAVVRAGRLLVVSRLEPIGFDGGWLKTRWDRASLEFAAYGGWGLGQASALTVLSPALNPLDEWRPRDRQIVAGAEAAWLYGDMDVRTEYRREVDPLDDYFVSERAALSFGARVAAVRAAGAVEYNIAEGQPGSADLTLTYQRPWLSVSGGARRYVPYFSLWTLWGAFSPVPYNAVNVSAQVRPTSWLSLNGRGERYRYENADVSTALVPRLQDRGWRASVGGIATWAPRWTLAANYGLEHGPGASGRFADGAVGYTPNDRFTFDVYGGTTARPLELRYYDATTRWIGGRAGWQLGAQRSLWGDVALVDDDRARPDAGASSLAQVRIRAGLSLTFGSGADRAPLPPARRTGP
ncbi:MAG TPA: hypothetical protein VFT29_15240 [Gemmatimonadaceae bacterium]|nr:hypothetical protein [Gemmatimonadaceae bacterium]